MIPIYFIDKERDKLFYGKEPVIIWGTGVAAECTYNYFKTHNMTQRILGFCDNNIKKCGKEYLDKHVFSYAELLDKEETIYIVLSGMYQIEIGNKLVGMQHFNIVYTYPFETKNYEQYSNTWNNLIKSNQQINKKIQSVRDLLSDELSKKSLDCILKVRETGDISHFINIARNPTEQYFDDLIKLGNNEVFVDCGAFKGETIDRFIEHSGKGARIYGFEPIKSYCELMCKKFNDNKDITIINAGTWDSKTQLQFQVDTTDCGGSCITEGGQEKIETDTIDNIANENQVTFIKMDIEGAEIQALMGAKNQIIKNKPKLAICLYHRLEDLYEIPLLIKEMVPEYKLFIRHYTAIHLETVLYAFI